VTATQQREATRPAAAGPAAAPAPRGRRLRRWEVTIAATVISTYALDGIATAAGVLLVASQALAGAGHSVLLGFLACTYVLWCAGLRVSLHANRALLERTGTSTNALSKAAYDLARRRKAGPRVQRLAAAGGYVGTELAKELPYYVGAFGAALLTDSVAARDALIFLAGTNLGAAAYEYGLARATRAYLSRRPEGPRPRPRPRRPSAAAARDGSPARR
jgi:hypothetical protein